MKKYAERLEDSVANNGLYKSFTAIIPGCLLGLKF